ncbi:MAG: N(4)-(beta-N-acetylglucosaminyl)-L-asparaginase [Verrucomicrobia bacterium]|nr:N(4)-(beta-N-acetylglucosaminyl)-L-asparaginase [Verrucomicrobiota bacterium]
MPAVTRRQFVSRSALAVTGASVGPRLAAATQPDPAELQARPPLIISTWPFGKPANDAALAVLLRGGSGLDAVEQGIRVTESDPDNASVGLGGIPNADGVVQLDACIMSGPGHRAGSVAAVSGFRHPISIARRVMETTRHVMLVGEGAEAFAAEAGFERGPRVSPKQKAAWQRWKKEQAAQAKAAGKHPNHDTIALLVLRADGAVFGGCSTSGWGYKIPGRVGDSPILGSGLYVDDEVGAAGATGVGENVMRHCGSFLVVELMRQGLHPQEACLEAIRRMARKDPLGFNLSVNFIALDRQGRFGAAGTGTGFQYAVTCESFSRVLQSPGLTSADIGPVGGNRK